MLKKEFKIRIEDELLFRFLSICSLNPESSVEIAEGVHFGYRLLMDLSRCRFSSAKIGPYRGTTTLMADDNEVTGTVGHRCLV